MKKLSKRMLKLIISNNNLNSKMKQLKNYKQN